MFSAARRALRILARMNLSHPLAALFLVPVFGACVASGGASSADDPATTDKTTNVPGGGDRPNSPVGAPPDAGTPGAASDASNRTDSAPADAANGKDGAQGDSASPPPSSCGLFPCDNPWYKDVSSLPAYTDQDLISAVGAWGHSGHMMIDFSIVALTANAQTQRYAVGLDSSYDPDNDHVDVPIPATGAVEGETGYNCTQGGDCHLIVVDTSQNKLFELWQASLDSGKWTATQETVWDLTKHYGPEGRGPGCTSADAAGLAILPGLIRPDEVASGEVKHAFRFILPGSKITHNGYVAPATHSTSAYSGQMPMGTRLRLRASFDESTLPSPGAKVVARAMKKYGILLADAGQDALTAESDQFTSTKWSGLLDASDLSSVRVTDFEVVDFGKVQTPGSMDCTRAP
jgi:serine/threonine-protein kinase